MVVVIVVEVVTLLTECRFHVVPIAVSGIIFLASSSVGVLSAFFSIGRVCVCVCVCVCEFV